MEPIQKPSLVFLPSSRKAKELWSSSVCLCNSISYVIERYGEWKRIVQGTRECGLSADYRRSCFDGQTAERRYRVSARHLEMERILWCRRDKAFFKVSPDSPLPPVIVSLQPRGSSPTGAGPSCPWNSYITNMPFHVCLCSPIWMLITGGTVPPLRETLTFDSTCSLQGATWILKHRHSSVQLTGRSIWNSLCSNK